MFARRFHSILRRRAAQQYWHADFQPQVVRALLQARFSSHTKLLENKVF
jgi:hypothetical protein